MLVHFKKSWNSDKIIEMRRHPSGHVCIPSRYQLEGMFDGRDFFMVSPVSSLTADAQCSLRPAGSPWSPESPACLSTSPFLHSCHMTESQILIIYVRGSFLWKWCISFFSFLHTVVSHFYETSVLKLFISFLNASTYFWKSYNVGILLMSAFNVSRGDLNKWPVEQRSPHPSGVFRNGIISEEIVKRHTEATFSPGRVSVNQVENYLICSVISVERCLDHCSVTSYLL